MSFLTEISLWNVSDNVRFDIIKQKFLLILSFFSLTLCVFPIFMYEMCKFCNIIIVKRGSSTKTMNIKLQMSNKRHDKHHKKSVSSSRASIWCIFEMGNWFLITKTSSLVLNLVKNNQETTTYLLLVLILVSKGNKSC